MKKIRDRTGLKQIAFDVEAHFHESLKRRASEQGISMKDWLMQAIMAKFIGDEDLGWE